LFHAQQSIQFVSRIGAFKISASQEAIEGGPSDVAIGWQSQSIPVIDAKRRVEQGSQGDKTLQGHLVQVYVHEYCDSNRYAVLEHRQEVSLRAAEQTLESLK
jgi:hypothetical protein